jgi:hypothetical protein
MNIEEFYDGDERRRESEELEIGAEWTDGDANRFALNYVIDTTEVYVMAMPDAEMVEDPFGDMVVDTEEPFDALTVEVLAHVPTSDELHQALTGWETHMLEPSSLEWLRQQLAAYPTG